MPQEALGGVLVQNGQNPLLLFYCTSTRAGKLINYFPRKKGGWGGEKTIPNIFRKENIPK